MITDEMLRSSAARSSELFAHTITSDYDPVQQYEPSDLFEKASSPCKASLFL